MTRHNGSPASAPRLTQNRQQRIGSRLDQLARAGVLRSWQRRGSYDRSGTRWILEWAGMTRVYTTAEAEAFVEGAHAAVHAARLRTEGVGA